MGTVGEEVSDNGVEKDTRGVWARRGAGVKLKEGRSRDEIRPIGFTLCLLGRG